jgi:hypothetical protein
MGRLRHGYAFSSSALGFIPTAMIFFGIILHRQAGAYGLSFVSAARLGLMSGPSLALSSPRFALMAA